MKSIKTKEGFLLDMLEYYTTDTNRRCIGGSCYYSPVNAGKEGVSEGCAIGRHLDSETQLLCDDSTYSSITELNRLTTIELPKWFKKLSVIFLQSIQNLHDVNYYWCSTGLSINGKSKVEELVEMYELNLSKFSKFIN